ncbi:conserved hypothetical protein [Betalipothrixvirus acidiani]|uniref:Uncharacterized protein n=1 Tax=Betalipothrixvirus acidiani TaxID=346881 RepID=A7WKA9_9VIRU|nr:hypothetical protein AFV3_gp20 [Acidianus filamentous virus 3]CAJ31510.1 conserved hypothetical protein [Acidianus filamentous virus 3]
MWTDISLDENNFEQDIFFYIYEQNWLKRQVTIIIPKKPKEYKNIITVKISHYLWIKDDLAEKKVLQFNFEVTDYTIEYWNDRLEMLKKIEYEPLLEMICKNCGCTDEKCYLDYKLRKIFIKELLKYLWREKLSVQTKMFKEECRETHLGFECYKLYDLHKFR